MHGIPGQRRGPHAGHDGGGRQGLGVEIDFLTPDSFRTFALPSYRDLRLALPGPSKIAELIERRRARQHPYRDEGRSASWFAATAASVACLSRRDSTPAFPSMFLRARRSREDGYGGALRAFHRPSQAVMAATPALVGELRSRGFRNVVLWSRGVDTKLFHPRDIDICLPGRCFCASAAWRWGEESRGVPRARSARQQR
jgi:hypothetical protein